VCSFEAMLLGVLLFTVSSNTIYILKVVVNSKNNSKTNSKPQKRKPIEEKCYWNQPLCCCSAVGLPMFECFHWTGTCCLFCLLERLLSSKGQFTRQSVCVFGLLNIALYFWGCTRWQP
jgi:hypothetical protein